MWNIEGLRRNAHNLHFLISKYKLTKVFLSEPQVFNCDVDLCMDIFNEYKYYANLPDDFDSDLPLDKLCAKGGTMVLWHSEVDKYVTVLNPPSSAVLPIAFKIPGFKPSCHIGVYNIHAYSRSE